MSLIVEQHADMRDSVILETRASNAWLLQGSHAFSAAAGYSAMSGGHHFSV